MKKFKNEKGAITILVLVSILFMVSFLISSYAMVANKVKAQKEVVAQTRAIYNNTEDIEEIYNSFLIDNIIPISNAEQLLAIGSDEIREIGGKEYTFSNDPSTKYVLMNDIEFNGKDYWVPINDRKDLLSLFDDNGKIITVEYKDSDDVEYTVTYDKENNISEPEYELTVKAVDESGQILSDAVIYVNGKEQPTKGETTVSIKRLQGVKIYAELDGYKKSEGEDVCIENPKKDFEDKYPGGVCELTLGNYMFTINPTPSNASVTINGQDTNSISVGKGQKIEWEVEATGYIAQEGEITIEEDTTLDVELEIKKHTITINPTPANAIVAIDGVETNSATVDYGTEVSYSVICEGYHSQEGKVTVVKDETINITLAEIGYIPFSESFYFTRCSDETFNGLLNGGSTTFSKYNLGGKDYSMGSFYLDEADIVDKVPATSTIFKVTVYFDYYQDRSNTFLYTNTIKTTIYTGDTEKMSQAESEKTNEDVQQAKYELTNITREELANSLRVDLINYIEGTLSIDSTVENLYCVIEGEYPDI